MDKLIEEEVSSKRKKKTYLIIFIIIIILAVIVWLVRFYFKPSLTDADINTARVETGIIENTINATGEVLPEFEEVLTSPINASIKNVLMDAGNKVNKGQSILSLDKSVSQTDYGKLQFQMESKENEIRKLKLDLEKSFFDIKSNNSIKQLRISNLKDAVSSAKRLLKAGGGTKEDVERAELDLKVAELEKLQLENEIRSKQQTMKIEIREAEIALAIQRNDLDALKRKLDLADVIATRPGVITWVNKNIGSSVHEGDALVKIADLSGFKVAGSMSDNLLDKIHNNMAAIIRIGNTQLRGSIVNISPSVSNAIVSFDIQLNQKDSKELRPNQKVDVFLVTATRNGVLRIANGPAFNGSNLQEVFVLKNGIAERRAVKTGLSNFDYVEILSGLKAGDEVITSDMGDYKNTKTITISN
ncbi:efflux RND transporter periplasmic adaptor subunit [Pedobacter alluvionis]|uniref:HlyD family efflux transporter periplasmic adaptor subunit n=1 Tax=Pedobacter alluvionis TaxID=475253 RepID=A0A497XR56_9SPHI|nr:HlyD family efflux transporter periplasmic adaptor subunit [Pedobacter alluvionis]RLJ69507.1 HlyD family secretion protein [Pedobacter alluvionis]TFB28420.1 HlyD family efflux transporter periplasmic adaptor subunit [Pedobacter alluvionis]